MNTHNRLGFGIDHQAGAQSCRLSHQGLDRFTSLKAGNRSIKLTVLNSLPTDSLGWAPRLIQS